MAKRATGVDGATTVRDKRANGAGSVNFDQANVAPHRMHPSSVGTVGKRLSPERLGMLADVTVVSSTSEQVQEWQSGLLSCKGSLSPSTVADNRVTLNQVLDGAVDRRLIAINPAKRVKPPRVPKSHGRHLDAADAQRLVAACSGARYGVVVAMLFMQGWRVSEVLGLAWSDLDLDEPTATVRCAVVQVPGVGRVLGPPKSEGAERLAAGPSWRTNLYNGERLVFTTEDGGIVAESGEHAVNKPTRPCPASRDPATATSSYSAVNRSSAPTATRNFPTKPRAVPVFVIAVITP